MQQYELLRMHRGLTTLHMSEAFPFKKNLLINNRGTPPLPLREGAKLFGTTIEHFNDKPRDARAIL